MSDNPLTFGELRVGNEKRCEEAGPGVRALALDGCLCGLAGGLGSLAAMFSPPVPPRRSTVAREVVAAIGDAMIWVDLLAAKCGIAALVPLEHFAPGAPIKTFPRLRAFTEVDWRSPTRTPDPDVTPAVLMADLLAVFGQFVGDVRQPLITRTSPYQVTTVILELHFATMFAQLDRLAYRLEIDLGEVTRGRFNATSERIGSTVRI